MIEAILYILFAAVFTTNGYYLIQERLGSKVPIKKGKSSSATSDPSYSQRLDTASEICDFLLIIYCTYSLFKIIKRILFMKFKFFNIFWNDVEIIIIVIALATSILDISFKDSLYQDKNTIQCIQSVGLYLIYLGILSYLRIFDELSFMIRTFLKCIEDIKDFIIILFIVGFGLSFSSKI